MSFSVTDIDDRSPYLADVMSLWREHSNTLGFLPEGAFEDQARQRKLLIARDGSGNLAGYLLYRTTRDHAAIVHLCVHREYRGCKLTRLLVDELCARTKRLRGISLWCRRDYDASHVWPRLGFIAQGEKPGRSAEGTTLTNWWLDHGHPDLFSRSAARTESDLRVVLDANVFFDLVDEDPKHEESTALLSDWLPVELCITDELLNEINRSDDHEARKRNRLSMTRFTRITSPKQRVDEVLAEVAQILPSSPNRISDESDLRQLARTIAADVQYFVTRDQRLLDAADPLYERYRIRVLRPVELIGQLDEMRRETEYQPVRFTGTQFRSARVQASSVEELAADFQLPEHGENRGRFCARLRGFIANPEDHVVEAIESVDGRPLALYTLRRDRERLEIPLMRLARHPGSPTLARHLLATVARRATQSACSHIVFSDECQHSALPDALMEEDYFQMANAWIKRLVRRVVSASEFQGGALLSSENPEWPPQVVGVLGGADVDSFWRFEKALWPLKIIDSGIPSYIIPIQPRWAMHLFDEGIAEQDLFGANTDLFFRGEKVYYKTGKPAIVSAPGRILWYVSGKDKQVVGAGAIRAVSMIDEVVIGDPKTVFQKFRRLGVFEWKDVSAYSVVLGMRFSRTELFSRRVPFAMAQQILQRSGIASTFQSATRISDAAFAEIYRSGTQMNG